MDSKTYACTPAQLGKLTTTLAGHGLVVDLTKDGEIVNGKWDVAWTVQPDSLTLTVKNHPFAQEGFFWNKVTEALS